MQTMLDNRFPIMETSCHVEKDSVSDAINTDATAVTQLALTVFRLNAGALLHWGTDWLNLWA